jgi:deoxyribodipyrimidine photolyase-related protein
MVEGDEFLFHAVISPVLNLGLLTPRECIERAVAAYGEGKVPLAGVEGFVRQIAGWREFVNGVYWLKMPDYVKANGLEAQSPLPGFFYTGETEMNCLGQCLRQVLGTGYNHHIQRLMVLGNFLLLAGVRPHDAANLLQVAGEALAVGLAGDSDQNIRAVEPFCEHAAGHQAVD